MHPHNVYPTHNTSSGPLLLSCIWLGSALIWFLNFWLYALFSFFLNLTLDMTCNLLLGVTLSTLLRYVFFFLASGSVNFQLFDSWSIEDLTELPISLAFILMGLNKPQWVVSRDYSFRFWWFITLVPLTQTWWRWVKLSLLLDDMNFWTTREI